VREVVTRAHFDLDRVRALVEARPSLARAAWDWGFGDWETALGAASHMGRADIARFLLDRGARPDVFSAAMLGQLAVVRAFLDADPTLAATPGPHGIPLLAHAEAGGDAARAVADYLRSRQDLAPAPRAVSADDARFRAWRGVYRYGTGEADTVEIAEHKGSLVLRAHDAAGRPLFHGAGDARGLHPAGAPHVRVTVVHADGPSARLRIEDGPLLLTAVREGVKSLP